MASDENMLLCYNRGCGQTFNPKENSSDSCRHHPGTPVFHDALKGWSCCNKKCTDFTEFLNIKGCTVSSHSNVKPVEPEKPKDTPLGKDEVIEVRAPIPARPKVRPPIDTPMIDVKSEISLSLKDALANACASSPKDPSPALNSESSEIPIGTPCKNNTCKRVYNGTNGDICTYHPGVPVFHEGLKYWSCCRKKTTEFDIFLAQPGCESGTHCWFKPKDENFDGARKADCRLDWHQTGSHVYVTIFAKKCDPSKSIIKANPVRLIVEIYIPDQDATYSNDIHLAGVVDVSKSVVSYFPAKVEVRLPKAQPGSWSRLEFAQTPSSAPKPNVPGSETKDIEDRVESVDLSCI